MGTASTPLGLTFSKDLANVSLDEFQTRRGRDAGLLAPPWHTLALVSLMVAVAATGTCLARHGEPVAIPPVGAPYAAVYLPMILVPWGLTLYVCRVGRPRNVLPWLLGRRWNGLARASIDVSLAAFVWVLIETSEAWFGRHGVVRNGATLAILPHTAAQRAAWVFIAVSAGFCEEVVYRGYLQTQLTALTGRLSLGILLQSVLFGIAHLEQGGVAGARFALYGCAFGGLAWWRGTLYPGIIAHIAIDLASGLLAR